MFPLKPIDFGLAASQAQVTKINLTQVCRGQRSHWCCVRHEWERNQAGCVRRNQPIIKYPKQVTGRMLISHGACSRCPTLYSHVRHGAPKQLDRDQGLATPDRWRTDSAQRSL
ncbi:hypothetical protein RRG08_025987 [Elysia crispata]|uniref:Uncharacterized protein n=1 Tax=Elysia crispata TaxID=231223 RepID=A0AAE0ZG07_9GAST|nr:hypothetical protein RRG08_025987 [Elysia crispata]